MIHKLEKPVGSFIYNLSALDKGTWVSCESRTFLGSNIKQRYFDIPLNEMETDFKSYCRGGLIQNVFPLMSGDDREWIITGGM